MTEKQKIIYGHIQMYECGTSFTELKQWARSEFDVQNPVQSLKYQVLTMKNQCYLKIDMPVEWTDKVASPLHGSTVSVVKEKRHEFLDVHPNQTSLF